MYSHRNSRSICRRAFSQLGVDSMINEHKERLREIRKELNSHKKAKDFHIGQVVFACKYNGFYMGEITKIIHTKSETLIELNKKEVLEFVISTPTKTKHYNK